MCCDLGEWGLDRVLIATGNFPCVPRRIAGLKTGSASGLSRLQKLSCKLLEVLRSPFRWPGVTSRNTVCALARGSIVVKTLCYKPEGREFQTR
jgi:hypothetical protein